MQCGLTWIMVTQLRATRVMRSRRWSVCRLCRAQIQPGQQIGKLFYPPSSWVHVVCINGENVRRRESCDALW